MDYLKQYLKITIFRISLNELPESIPFLQQSLFVYLIIGFLIQANIGEPVEAVLETLIEILFTTILIFVLLLFAGKTSSFIQTFTSFIISENLIFVLALPIAVWLDFFDDIISLYIACILIVGLVFWYLCIISYLMRQLLSISRLAAFLLAVGYTLLTYIFPFFALLF